MKTCSKCGEMKAVVEFSPDARKTDGLYAQCKVCRVETCRIHREENREKVRESSREWGRRNKEHVKENLKEWRGRDSSRYRKALQNSRATAKRDKCVACTATEEQLHAAFTGLCEVCGVPEMELTSRLQMDHDRKTGEFRGWLCGKCNKASGLLNDSVEIMVDLLHYHMAHAETT